MSLSPVICRLTPEAAEQVAAIEQVCNRPPWPKELFESEFNHSYSYTFGARRAGKLIGFLVCHFVLDEVHILNFGVAPEERRTGVGRALLTNVLETLFERGARWASLEVRLSNSAARGLYRGVGFQEVGTRAAYYTDDGEDALVLQLDIEAFIAREAKKRERVNESL